MYYHIYIYITIYIYSMCVNIYIYICVCVISWTSRSHQTVLVSKQAHKSRSAPSSGTNKLMMVISPWLRTPLDMENPGKPGKKTWTSMGHFMGLVLVYRKYMLGNCLVQLWTNLNIFSSRNWWSDANKHVVWLFYGVFLLILLFKKNLVKNLVASRICIGYLKLPFIT